MGPPGLVAGCNNISNPSIRVASVPFCLSSPGNSFRPNSGTSFLSLSGSWTKQDRSPRPSHQDAERSSGRCECEAPALVTALCGWHHCVASSLTGIKEAVPCSGRPGLPVSEALGGRPRQVGSCSPQLLPLGCGATPRWRMWTDDRAQAWEYAACAYRIIPIQDGREASWCRVPVWGWGGGQKMSSELTA